MKQIILWLAACVLLSGCAGLADYTISLDNGYRIDRLSAHQIQIYGEEAVNDGDDTVFNHLYVPAEVTAIWSDEQYIVAKQLRLQADERGYEQPPENPTEADYAYWIIEMASNEVTGPLSLTELEQVIGTTIKFTPIEKLEREP